MDKKTYDKKLPFAITKEQDAKLDEMAARCKITKAEVLRRLIDGTVLLDHECFLILRDLNMEIHKIGININQIVKNNNSFLYNASDKMMLMHDLRTIKLQLERVCNAICEGGVFGGNHKTYAHERE